MMKLNLQFFGGRGALAGTGASGGKTASQKLVGKTTTGLKDYVSMKKEDFDKAFGIEGATVAQTNAIKAVMRGIIEHDKGYDAEKTPFKIDDVRIEFIGGKKTDEEIKEEKKLLGRSYVPQSISVYISTVPQSDSAYIRMLDTKYRNFLVGAKGGYYTYGKSSKRVSISRFDAMYGRKG